MAKKKVGGIDKSKKKGGNGKEDGNSGGGDRVLRLRSATKGGGDAAEKPKGKKPMVKKGNLTVGDEDGAQKGQNTGKRMGTKEEEAEMAKTPAKRRRNAGEDVKGKSILVAEEEEAEMAKTPAKRRRNAGEDVKGKSILVAEVNADKSKVLTKRRHADKEMSDSYVPSAVKGLYNLRARKSVPSVIESKLQKDRAVSEKDKGGEEMDSDGDMVVSEIVNISQKKNFSKLVEKRATNVGKKKGYRSQKIEDDGDEGGTSLTVQKRGNAEKKAENMVSKKRVSKEASASKTKPLKKTKMDEGPLSVEKRKKPAKKVTK
ncbi:hypothetical protein U1Q18_012885 [Sarracenia purpurea var. burkii]